MPNQSFAWTAVIHSVWSGNCFTCGPGTGGAAGGAASGASGASGGGKDANFTLLGHDPMPAPCS